MVYMRAGHVHEISCVAQYAISSVQHNIHTQDTAPCPTPYQKRLRKVEISSTFTRLGNTEGNPNNSSCV